MRVGIGYSGALDEFHDEVGQAVIGSAAVKQTGDADGRGGQDLALGAETPENEISSCRA